MSAAVTAPAPEEPDLAPITRLLPLRTATLGGRATLREVAVEERDQRALLGQLRGRGHAVARGATLAVRRDELPDPEPDAYYVFQLVGLTVEEEGGRPLGAVTDVSPGPANDALVLDSGLLLPLVESCVLDVDLDARRVLVARGFADAE